MKSYSGKLKNHTEKTTNEMFIPVNVSGTEKMIPVSFVSEDKILYISGSSYERFKTCIKDLKEIELKKTPFSFKLK